MYFLFDFDTHFGWLAWFVNKINFVDCVCDCYCAHTHFTHHTLQTHTHMYIMLLREPSKSLAACILFKGKAESEWRNENFITGQNEREETTQDTIVTKSAACASYEWHRLQPLGLVPPHFRVDFARMHAADKHLPIWYKTIGQAHIVLASSHGPNECLNVPSESHVFRS